MFRLAWFSWLLTMLALSQNHEIMSQSSAFPWLACAIDKALLQSSPLVPIAIAKYQDQLEINTFWGYAKKPLMLKETHTQGWLQYSHHLNRSADMILQGFWELTLKQEDLSSLRYNSRTSHHFSKEVLWDKLGLLQPWKIIPALLPGCPPKQQDQGHLVPLEYLIEGGCKPSPH